VPTNALEIEKNTCVDEDQKLCFRFFQLSTLITVYLGHRYFAERNIRRRLLGSLIMVIGAILIVTLGRRA
jgi:hypothetical protein